MRGFTQPLAVVVGLLVCVVIGYALVSGFSHARSAGGGPIAVVGEGASLDAPLPGALSSEEPPAQAAVRPNLPALPAAEPEASKPNLVNGYREISFASICNYTYVYPELDAPQPPPDQIPQAVKKLDGTKIAIRGFMNPVRIKDGRVTEFLLLKDQTFCCFGVYPGMNEWIHVILEEGQTAPFVPDIPTTVFGTFEVGEVYEKKVLMSIYRMRFDRLVEPAR